MIRALRLDCPGIRFARQHKLLAGKSLIARGAFSAIFDGRKKDTILKMTIDDASYWLLNDPVVGVKHCRVPRVVENFGEIGEVRINGKGYAVYLYEIERLVKIQRGTPAARLAKFLMGRCQCCSDGSDSWWRDPEHAREVFRELSKDGEITQSFRNAFARMADFCRHVDCHIDLHSANLMRRPNGELVITDPIANMNIWTEAQEQLRRRGW